VLENRRLVESDQGPMDAVAGLTDPHRQPAHAGTPELRSEAVEFGRDPTQLGQDVDQVGALTYRFPLCLTLSNPRLRSSHVH
jgi:hypothetical protein